MLPQPPTNFSYNQATKVLSWDAVPGAFAYGIMSKPDIEGTNWGPVYCGGNNTSCPFNKTPGRHKVKGQSGNEGGGWGAYGPEEIVEVLV